MLELKSLFEKERGKYQIKLVITFYWNYLLERFLTLIGINGESHMNTCQSFRKRQNLCHTIFENV